MKIIQNDHNKEVFKAKEAENRVVHFLEAGTMNLSDWI